MIPEIVNDLLRVAQVARFRLSLWDYAVQDDGDPPQLFSTAFNTGPNAVNCLRQLIGSPICDPLVWVGNADDGYIDCDGIRVARYRFQPIE